MTLWQQLFREWQGHWASFWWLWVIFFIILWLANHNPWDDGDPGQGGAGA